MNLGIILAQAAKVAEATEKVVETVKETNLTDAAVGSAKSLSIWSSIMHSDPLVKLTLLILLGFSIMCWTVIFLKIVQLRKSQAASQGFWQRFSGLNSLSEVKTSQSMKMGPLYQIFLSGLESINHVRKSGSNFSQHSFDSLKQRLNQAKEEELHKLEQYVSFLATTAAVAPFIGLFGTVWGILSAFMVIGKTGTSNLATVGPFIAEALVATAVGLFAAIPAVIFYNYFVGKIRVIHKMIDIFVDDFLLKSEKELRS